MSGELLQYPSFSGRVARVNPTCEQLTPSEADAAEAEAKAAREVELELTREAETAETAAEAAEAAEAEMVRRVETVDVDPVAPAGVMRAATPGDTRGVGSLRAALQGCRRK